MARHGSRWIREASKPFRKIRIPLLLAPRCCCMMLLVTEEAAQNPEAIQFLGQISTSKGPTYPMTVSKDF